MSAVEEYRDAGWALPMTYPRAFQELADAAIAELEKKLEFAKATIAANVERIAGLEQQVAYYKVQFEFDPNNDTRLVDAVARADRAEAMFMRHYCGDCRYCTDPDDSIPGCDQPFARHDAE